MPLLACGKEGARRQWGIGAEECVRENRSSEDIQRIRKVRVQASRRVSYSRSWAVRETCENWPPGG